jgi:uncharacterized membrane protein
MATADQLLLALTLVAALGCGLMAGLFFAFSVSVMKALARLPSAEGIAAMQSINSKWTAWNHVRAAAALAAATSLKRRNNNVIRRK